HLVVSRRQCDVDLMARTPVQLRRPACAGPGPTRRSAVYDLQQAFVRQLVQMERRQTPRNADGRRGLVPADKVSLTGHIAIPRSPSLVFQHGQALDVAVDVMPPAETHGTDPPVDPHFS